MSPKRVRKMSGRQSLYQVFFYSRSDVVGDWTAVLVKATTERKALSKARRLVGLVEFPFAGNVVRVR